MILLNALNDREPSTIFMTDTDGPFLLNDAPLPRVMWGQIRLRLKVGGPMGYGEICRVRLTDGRDRTPWRISR